MCIYSLTYVHVVLTFINGTHLHLTSNLCFDYCNILYIALQQKQNLWQRIIGRKNQIGALKMSSRLTLLVSESILLTFSDIHFLASNIIGNEFLAMSKAFSIL